MKRWTTGTALPFFLGVLLCMSPIVEGGLAAGEGPLCLVIHPSFRQDIVKSEYEALTEVLTLRLGRKVVVKPLESFNEVVDILRGGNLTMAILGRCAVRQLRDRRLLDGMTPIANQVLDGRDTYHGVVVVRDAGRSITLGQLRGWSLAIPHERSMAGWVVLQDELRARGIRPDKFFGRIVRTGDHLTALDALLEGRVDGASVSELALRFRDYEMRRHPLVVIHRTRQVSFDQFFVANDLSERMKEAIIVTVLGHRTRTPVGRVIKEWRRVPNAAVSLR